MRTPIAYGLGYPDRIDAGVSPLDLAKAGKLEFQALDLQRFPCVRLAYQALRRGATAPAILNAANEVAVEGFLSGEIAFTAIPELIEEVLTKLTVTVTTAPPTLAQILAADQAARVEVRSICSRSKLRSRRAGD